MPPSRRQRSRTKKAGSHLPAPRLLPRPERFALLREHVVTQGERLDNITALHLDDPEQFWRICDANRAMRPAGLTERIGRRLRITLPEGVPGMPDG